MKVSYLGPEGSYTHHAVIELFQNKADLVPCSTVTNAIHDLAVGLVDKAVVPVENSIAGGVAETIEAIQRQENIYVANEYILPITHCLLGSESVVSDLSTINKLRSHHMSLGQCMDYIAKNLANAEIIPSSSNSAAAKDLSQRILAGEDCSRHVVIASKLCAETYKLKVITENINDSSINETRFWILSKNIANYNPAAKNKTTILFQTKDEPGSLQVVLRLFAVNNVNLSRIESRPAKKNIGEYLFLVDINLHRDDDKFDDLMRQMKQHLTYYKWLGSYSLIE
jgi:prephenate dehydratase